MGNDEKKSKKRHHSRSHSRSRERNDRRKENKKEKKRHRSRSQESRKHHRDREKDRHPREEDNKISDEAKKSKVGNGNDINRLADIISQRVDAEQKSEEEREKDREKQREAEQAQLDEEMRKRRERVKAWQEAKAARLAAQSDQTVISSEASEVNDVPIVEDSTAAWTLDDDDEDSAAETDAAPVDMEIAESGVSTTNGSVEMSNGFKPLDIIENTPKLDPEKSNLFDRITLTTLQSHSHTIQSTTVPSTTAPKPVTKVTSKSSRFARHKAASDITVVPVEPLSKPNVPSQLPIAASIANTDGHGDDEDDPLDSFMTVLLRTEDVVAQAALPPSGTGKTFHSARAGVDASTKAAAEPGMKTEEELQLEEFDEDEKEDNSSTSDLLHPSYSMTISKGITLGEILAASKSVQKENNTEPVEPSSEGAVGGESVEDEEEDVNVQDDKEERERREFMEALRRSHTIADTTVSNDTATGKDEGAGRKRNEIGRVFAGEGDIMDESEIESQKKSALEILEEQKKGKEMKAIDHSTIVYEPFRKNLYIVPRALSRLSEVEVRDKRELLQVKVRGRGCPVPVDTWEQCGLSERILRVIEKLEFKAPFSVQKQAIPAIMCGRDVISVAKTGSGKTLAFLLPMFRHILDQPPLKDSEGPIGLIMAPARELAFQIYNEAKKFTKALGLRVTCIYGGAGVVEQIAELKRGADIVVCTPGRMIDILCMQAGKLVSLKRVTMVVMDEADRMFDMGFEPQIRMIIQNIRPDRQTVLFSATFPKQIEKLAKGILKLPLEIVVGDKSSANTDIVQHVEVHEEDDKFMRLLQLLGLWYERGSVLIFVDRQEKCDQLFQDLLKSGYPCLSLHGGKDQVDRDHTLQEFKTLIKTVMVATSVAGRGLDVPEIVCVINYNCPNHIEDYVHRIGRTGRAGRKGTAYTFISPQEEQFSPTMLKVLERAGQPIPEELAVMSKQFKEKVERGEAHWSTGGFVGKGFSFDASEMNESQKLASMQRRAYEIEQGIVPERPEDDEVDFEEDRSDDEEGGGGGRESKTQEGVTDTDSSAGQFQGLLPPPHEVESAAMLMGTVGLAGAGAALTPLERARVLAVSLGINKAPVTMSTATAPMTMAPPSVSTDGKVDTKAALARAKMIAQQMAALKNGGVGKPDETSEMHFQDEFEINDYPAQARRKVTHRTALDEVTERTGVAIISRGSFVPPGKKLEPGERKLFLLIEGSSDMQVKQARLELQRLLDEETLRLGANVTGGQYGRYSILVSENFVLKTITLRKALWPRCVTKLHDVYLRSNTFPFVTSSNGFPYSATISLSQKNMILRHAPLAILLHHIHFILNKTSTSDALLSKSTFARRGSTII
eukprot:gene242-447_t